jgi:hypothetical protein
MATRTPRPVYKYDLRARANRKAALNDGILLREMHFKKKSKNIGAGIQDGETQNKAAETIVRANIEGIAHDSMRAVYKYTYEEKDLNYVSITLYILLAATAILTAFASTAWFYITYLSMFGLMSLAIPIYFALSYFSLYRSTRIIQLVGVVIFLGSAATTIAWGIYSLPSGDVGMNNALWLRVIVGFLMFSSTAISFFAVCCGINMEHGYLGFAVACSEATNLGRLVLSASGSSHPLTTKDVANDSRKEEGDGIEMVTFSKDK